MNIAQILKLSLVDQSEVHICLEWRKTPMVDELKYLNLNIDQHLVGGSFKLKLLVDQSEVHRCLEITSQLKA
jgi:hypothetical protein